MTNITVSKKVLWASLLMAFIGIFFMRAPTADAAMMTSIAQKVAGQSQARPFILPDSLPNKSGVNVVIPENHVYMNSKYTFVPTVTAQTQVTNSGSGHHWTTRDWSDINSSDQPKSTKYFSVKARSYPELKGKMWVKYSNIGTANGKPVDLKIMINDWKEFYPDIPSGQNVSFRKDQIAFSMRGYEWVDMTWQFLDHASQNPVNVSGYFTFGDIDMGQGIEFSNNTSNAIDALILEPGVKTKGSNLNLNTSGGKVYIHDTITDAERASGFDEDVPDNSRDVRQRFSLLYSNQNQLRFRWRVNQEFVVNPHNHSRARYTGGNANHAAGEYMFYEIDKPVSTLPGAPIKKGKINVDKKIGEYTVQHTVPVESDKFYYTNYRLIDEVKPGLINPRIQKVTDQYGKDVSSWFSIMGAKTKAVAEAKLSTLKNPAFYGNSYTIHVIADIDFDYINNQNNGSFSFENKGLVQTNNQEVKTDAVSPPVQKRTLVVKHINQDNNDVMKETKRTVFPGSRYREEAIFDKKAYGTEGVLEHVKTSFGGKDYGPAHLVEGPLPDRNTDIVFYYRSPFNVSITHLDNDTDEVIHVDRNIDKKYKGDSWTYKAGLPKGKDTFEQDGVKYPYYPVTPSKTGKMDFQKGNKDYRYHLDFRYVKPNVDAGLKFVKIKTDDNDAGLPIEMAFDMKSIDEAHWGGEDRWASTMLTVKIIDKSDSNKVIYNKNHRAKDLRDDTLKWTIPKTGLKVNEARNYEIELSAPKKEDLYVRPGHNKISTIGYTASEEVVKISSSNSSRDRTLTDEWVAMTEKTVGTSPIIEHMEGLELSVDKTDKMPTGYGHGAIYPVKTWTDLAENEIPVVEGHVIADTELSEGDYETNSQGKHVIDVDESEARNHAEKSALTSFSFPQTYVTEGGDGDVVIADGQPSGSVDGGKRMYIPVWLDELGSYSYTFKSTEPVGRNRVKVEIEQVVDVESYMFAHSDSKTLKKDALLLQPTADGWFADFTQNDPFETRKDHVWQASDFTFNGSAITGFSDEGLAYYQEIPEGTARLEIPTKNPTTGETITEIKGTSPSEKGSFYNYTFVGDFDAPSVKKIGDYAFYNSQFSGQFSASELTDVGHYAFNHSQFTGVMNATKVKRVGNYAFYHSTFDGTVSIDTVGIDAFYHSAFGNGK